MIRAHPRYQIGLVVACSFAILAIGALYEIIEWGLTVLLAPEDAERYNGQQGDLWDPQKDMALAGLGAALGVCALSLLQRKRQAPRETP